MGKGGAFEVVVRGPALLPGQHPPQFNPLEMPAAVTGILGAGNTDIPNDIIDPMVKENSVVVYKSNPVMARGAEVKRRIFEPLIRRGYLAMFHGGVEQGKLIVESPKVDRLGCTGAVGTHDRIVWGDQDKNDPEAKPLTTKPFLSELGSVNPYIIVPGDWSASEIKGQAIKLVSYKMFNSAHICAAPQVLITCKQWPQREAFLTAVRERIKECLPYRLFYPGVRKAYDEHKAALGGSDITSQQKALPGEDPAPLLFRTGVAINENGEDPLAVRCEAFAPILIEVPIDTQVDFEQYMPAAVKFAEDKCWGTLTCAITMDDHTKAKNQLALDSILDGMRFGAIGVNVPPSLANIYPALTWGGFPGHTNRDVQSGIGILGNFYCYKHAEKTILQGRANNLLQLDNSGKPAYQMKKQRRISDLFLYNSFWAITKFASAHFTGI